MKKRLLSILLAFSMVLTFLPLNAVTAFADDGDENIVARGTCGAEGNDGDNLTWELNQDGTLTISGTGEMADYANKSGMRAPWCLDYRDNITKVVIGDNVTSIGDYAFFWCKKLTSIDFSAAKITSIGENAFEDCSSLESIGIPSTVTEIGSDAFSGCSSLGSIELPVGVTSIENRTFLNSGLSSIKINGNITSIGMQAFRSCKFTSFKIPDGVTTIGSFAFMGCKQLESIEIPKNIDSIAANAFNSCSALKTVKYNGTEEDFAKLGDVFKNVTPEMQYAHTVTFDNGGYADAQSVVVPYNETAKAPKLPAVKGYTFAGYFADEDYQTEFKLATEKITEDQTVYVKWEKIPDHQLTIKDGTLQKVVMDEEDITEEITKDDDGNFIIPEDALVTVAFNKDAFADSHLKFSYWDIEGLTQDEANRYNKLESFTFKMPAKSVTLEAMTQDDSIDDAVAEALGNTAIVGTAILGGAALGVTGYMLGTEMYLICLLPIGTPIPANTAQLAELVWTDAGKPAPAAVLPEDATEDQQAMAWAVESDLIDADKAPDASVSRIEVIKTWKKAQSVKVG